VDSLESRFELQKLLADISGRPEERAVNYALLRSLQRAVYSPEEEGHYALASDCYCHFTSPIRRYPDLTVHRLLESLWSGKKPRNDFGELAVLGEHCSDRERRSEDAERELTRVKLLEYLSTRIGTTLEGIVTGVEEFGIFVQGIRLPAEGLVHVSSLADDYYRFDRRTHTLAGHRAGNAYRLGDVVTVTVARVDVDRRELDLRVVGRGPTTPARKRIGSKRERNERRDKTKAKNRAKGKEKPRRRK
jgi:ribonuclease R